MKITALYSGRRKYSFSDLNTSTFFFNMQHFFKKNPPFSKIIHSFVTF